MKSHSKKPRSSASKATAPKTSTPKRKEIEELAHAFSIGHRPAKELAPQDESLFRAFQSNLLSLISHELRTPLTGVLNALQLLDNSEGQSEFTAAELVSMARRNAQRLHRSMAALLDLAALESKTFHARLREVQLRRLVESRLKNYDSQFKDHELTLKVGTEPQILGTPILVDPQRLGRAVDLCLDVVIPRAERGTAVQLRLSHSRVEIEFRIQEQFLSTWVEKWSQSLAGFHGGVVAPGSAFSGAMTSEREFLSRVEEGLGAEFLLIHEIMRLHAGQFSSFVQESAFKVVLKLEFPELSSEDGLNLVLASRAYEASTELNSVTISVFEVPVERSEEAFQMQVRKSLFRATDAVYFLPAKRLVVLVMDDCKPEDVPQLMYRIEEAVETKLKYGLAACPSDGVDPGYLLDIAQKRMSQK